MLEGTAITTGPSVRRKFTFSLSRHPAPGFSTAWKAPRQPLPFWWTPNRPTGGFWNIGRQANQPSAALTADPDGDGLPNLLEYAFGLDPNLPGAGGLPRVEIRPAGDDDYLCISYRRPEGREDLGIFGSVFDGSAGVGADRQQNHRNGMDRKHGWNAVISVRDIAPIEGERRLLRVRVNWLQHEKST